MYDLDRGLGPTILNISTRGRVEAGDGVMIGGFIVTGNSSQKVIVRAIGPSLGGVGVADALSDPTLELHDGNGGLIASNNDWRAGGPETEIIATNIPLQTIGIPRSWRPCQQLARLIRRLCAD